MFIPERVAQRAHDAYTVDENGCHISIYSTASHGYAQIGWQVAEGKREGTTAHRAAWVHEYGQIPSGMTLDHTCRNRRCVRVGHLRLMTNYDNARRNHPDHDWPVGNGECRHGHPASRVQVGHAGKRICRDCRAQWQRNYRARKTAAQ